jgi:hypothetical protein
MIKINSRDYFYLVARDLCKPLKFPSPLGRVGTVDVQCTDEVPSNPLLLALADKVMSDYVPRSVAIDAIRARNKAQGRG